MDKRYHGIIEKALRELFDKCHRLEQERMEKVFELSAHLLQLMQAEGVKLYLTGGMMTSRSNDYTYLLDQGGVLTFEERHSVIGQASLPNLDRVAFAPYLQSYSYSSSVYPYNANGLIILSLSCGETIFNQVWESRTIQLLERNPADLPAEVAAGLADMLAARELDRVLRSTDCVLKNNGRVNIKDMLDQWQMARRE